MNFEHKNSLDWPRTYLTLDVYGCFIAQNSLTSGNKKNIGILRRCRCSSSAEKQNTQYMQFYQCAKIILGAKTI